MTRGSIRHSNKTDVARINVTVCDKATRMGARVVLIRELRRLLATYRHVMGR